NLNDVVRMQLECITSESNVTDMLVRLIVPRACVVRTSCTDIAQLVLSKISTAAVLIPTNELPTCGAGHPVIAELGFNRTQEMLGSKTRALCSSHHRLALLIRAEDVQSATRARRPFSSRASFPRGALRARPGMLVANLPTEA